MPEDIRKRIDAITKIGEDRIKCGPVQPAPLSVKIELTNRCNLRCKYCAVRTRAVAGKEDMDIDFFRAIVTDMKIAGVQEIGVFYLGESFTAPDLLVQAIRSCKDAGIPYVFLTSNATLATSDVVKRCMEAGLDSLKWSVNCSDREQWQHVTGSKGEWMDIAIENIKDAWRVRFNENYDCMLSASSILYSPEQMVAMEELLRTKIRAWVDTHYWLPLYSMGMYADKIKEALGYKPTHGNMGRLDEATLLPTRAPLPCWSAFTEGHVRVDGGLSACCFGSDNKFDMGLLNGDNFMKEWNSPRFQSLRRAQLETINNGASALIGTPCEVCVAY